MHKTEMLIAAQEFLYHGVSVIPLNETKPAIPWKEYQTRLPTQKELLTWFTEKTKYNIGIVTGRLSGISVWDVEDIDKAKAIFAKYRHLFKTIVLTPLPGVHFYGKYAGERNTQGDKETVRGEGEYVVAPPSVIDGKPYRYLDGFVNGSPSELYELPRVQQED